MKIILLVIFISSCTTVSRLAADNFKNYSYNISGGMMAINTQHYDTLSYYFAGTGFFIRKNGNLFLITAKHVFSSCDKNFAKNNLYPESLFMLINTKYGARYLNLDISAIKDSVICLPFYLSPDMIVMQIKDTLQKYINSVEDFILPPFKKLKNSIALGYPIDRSFQNGRYHWVSPSAIFFSENSYAVIKNIPIDSLSSGIDSIKLWDNF